MGYAYGATVGWADPSTPVTAGDCAALIQNGFGNGISWGQARTLPDGTPCRQPAYTSQAGNFHTPYYEQWSVGIQQAIGDKTSVSLTYVGNHGVHIPILNEGLNARTAYVLRRSLLRCLPDHVPRDRCLTWRSSISRPASPTTTE